MIISWYLSLFILFSILVSNSSLAENTERNKLKDDITDHEKLPLEMFCENKATMITGNNKENKGNRCDTLVKTQKHPATFIFEREANISLSALHLSACCT